MRQLQQERRAAVNVEYSHTAMSVSVDSARWSRWLASWGLLLTVSGCLTDAEVRAPSKAEPRAKDPSAIGTERPPQGGGWQGCGFPQSLEGDFVSAWVKLQAHVGPDGRANAVDVLASSDARFEGHARSCALGRRYQPARNAQGEAIADVTPPFIVKFTR